MISCVNFTCKPIWPCDVSSVFSDPINEESVQFSICILIIDIIDVHRFHLPSKALLSGRTPNRRRLHVMANPISQHPNSLCTMPNCDSCVVCKTGQTRHSLGHRHLREARDYIRKHARRLSQVRRKDRVSWRGIAMRLIG